MITLPKKGRGEYFSDLSKNGEKFVDSIVKRVVSSIMENNLKRITRKKMVERKMCLEDLFFFFFFR